MQSDGGGEGGRVRREGEVGGGRGNIMGTQGFRGALSNDGRGEVQKKGGEGSNIQGHRTLDTARNIQKHTNIVSVTNRKLQHQLNGLQHKK